MKLLTFIAVRHLLARKRQSIVSLTGIILGVSFFLAISSLMRGSERDFINRLVDNLPHINIVDEFRNSRKQPALMVYERGAVEISNVKPVTENRGVRGFKNIIKTLKSIYPDIKASPTLAEQALISSAGKNYAITVNGMIPSDILEVTTIKKYMIAGNIENLDTNSNGIIMGRALAKKLALEMGNNITLTSNTGQVRIFKIVGLFHVGRSSYDERQAFIQLKKAQTLLDRPNRINNIIIKVKDPYAAREIAENIENIVGYKSVSWQETSQDILSSLVVRNVIMYSVVSTLLFVAALGIYNVISTIIMEKRKDISILKSMGFYASDIKKIFLTQGVILGTVGCALGIPLGSIMIKLLSTIRLRPPGASEEINIPVDWSVSQFLIAYGFAMVASMLASLLPARKAADVKPVDILRGS
ncbi:MAG: ABC transporter permease [Rickettsiales bacterium]